MIKNYINKIIKQNCIDGMKQIEDNSVDLIIADPPYNLSKGKDLKWNNSIKVKGFGGDWNKVMEKWDNIQLVDYFSFTVNWLTECKRILKPTGSIWVFGSYHNIGIINFIFQLLEIEIINEVIWYKRNSFPNLSGRRLTASHENILWGHSGGKKRSYKFNYDLMKESEFQGDLLKQKGKQLRTVWDIPNNKKKEELAYGKHPTQKPIRVCERIILSSSDEGDIILAPFAGAGSECISALKLNRKFIGFEIEDEYIEIAKKRINGELNNKKEVQIYMKDIVEE
ncbi:DNA-methyltransferase [Metaclostridioides mangenotii]|uniref:DNA-methyltransferase n=1 Tax=Metaclostridioides mangenotii TaxID=1540 RepID=UPI000464E3D3|nr:site-specific DNA-methyltransferase [Clostridioides mangenotii]